MKNHFVDFSHLFSFRASGSGSIRDKLLDLFLVFLSFKSHFFSPPPPTTTTTTATTITTTTTPATPTTTTTTTDLFKDKTLGVVGCCQVVGVGAWGSVIELVPVQATFILNAALSRTREGKVKLKPLKSKKTQSSYWDSEELF